MPRINVQQTEDIESVILRFRRAVSQTYKRPWYKRRYGYYEKPSLLRYKRHRMQKRNYRHNYFTRVVCPIGLKEQLARTGRNAIGE